MTAFTEAEKKLPTFRVQISSDVAYERLIAEIYVDEKVVALVSLVRACPRTRRESS
jgi:hypothetical protein